MISSPIKYHGGKRYLAERIVSMMPKHLNYVEPYFGGGSVLFRRDPEDPSLWMDGHKGVSEVINDLDGEVSNFYQVLRHAHMFKIFKRDVGLTPFDGHEYADAAPCEYDAPVDRARKFFVRNRQSLAGRMKSFTGITKTRTRGGMSNEVSAWLSAIDGLDKVHERLRRVLVLPPWPALKVIEKFDAPETLFYLDPPYVSATRVSSDVYGHEMDDSEHWKLLQTIEECKAKVMISGYPSEIYDHFLDGWHRIEISIANHASGAKEKPVKTEVIWANFEPGP